MNREELDEFFADAEDVLTNWQGSLDSMDTTQPRQVGPQRWVVVDLPSLPRRNIDPWLTFVREALTDPTVPNYGDQDWALGAALAKMLDREIREWCSACADPLLLGVVCHVPIEGWRNPYSEVTIWGIPVRRQPGITWPILGRELERI